MTRAIYIRREDGDFDFVAAFDVNQLPSAPSDWPQEIAEWLALVGEDVKVVDCDLTKLPDVWTDTNAGTPN